MVPIHVINVLINYYINVIYDNNVLRYLFFLTTVNCIPSEEKRNLHFVEIHVTMYFTILSIAKIGHTIGIKKHT